VSLSLVSEVLRQELSRVQYETQLIRLSELLHELKRYADLPTEPEEKRYHAHMNAGNELRQTLGRGDALAILAVSAIAEERERFTGSANKPAARRAYLLRSLKHPAEVDTLRKVYGDAFFVIAAYSARERRIDTLAQVFAKSHGEMQEDKFRHEAERIVVRDEAEMYELGQQVRDTFPLADFFVSTDDRSELEAEIRRFLQILFRHPSHTPRRHEMGMFQARAAALRSADLSRQVGAVVCSRDGEVLALGCNEVPKAGGGAYWTGDAPDQRDFAVGYDSSARMKEDIIREQFQRLKEAKWLKANKLRENVDVLMRMALYEGQTPFLQGAQITHLLEFGRIVHAEMAALTDACRLGSSLRGATLYCTTFPCHMCARHIVASGIERVVYIEPYPKSMAAKLYPDSISVDGRGAAKAWLSLLLSPGLRLGAMRIFSICLSERMRKVWLSHGQRSMRFHGWSNSIHRIS
jgi:deoxycytidylate deaminase